VSVWLPGELMLYLGIIKKIKVMSTQIFMMLIIGVSIIRFFKGIFNKKQTQFKEEVAGFLLHVTIVGIVYIIIYFILVSIFA